MPERLVAEMSADEVIALGARVAELEGALRASLEQFGRIRQNAIEECAGVADAAVVHNDKERMEFMRAGNFAAADRHRHASIEAGALASAIRALNTERRPSDE